MTYSLTLRELIGPSGSTTKGAKLSTSELDGNFIYLQNLATTQVGGVVVLNYESNNNDTISATASVVLVSSDTTYYTFNLNLPTPTIGWQMTIIRTDNFMSENFISIIGSFFGGGSYFGMSVSGLVVVIVFDGTVWHIISTNA